MNQSSSSTHQPGNSTRIYTNLLELFVDFEGGIDRILQLYTEVMPDIAFAGFAKKAEGEQLRIEHVDGECGPSLRGLTFSIGEGYLGQVALTETDTHWHCLTHDPRLRLFTSRDMTPKHLYGYSVRVHDELIGVLFCGSTIEEPDHHEVMQFGRMIAHLWGGWLTKQYLLDELDLQRSRLTILIEVAKVLETVRDLRRVMFLLVDMTLNLIPDARAALTMVSKPQEPGMVELVTRGFAKEHADGYSKYLAHKYWRHEQPTPPIGEGYADDATYLDYALTVQGEVVGVLGVELGATERYPSGSRELLATLAYMGSAAVKKHHSSQAERMHKQVSLLHELLQQWDHSQYKRTRDSSRIAEEYGKYMQWDHARIQVVTGACKLLEYELRLLKEADIPQEILRLIGETRSMPSMGVGDSSYTYDAKLVYLIARYAEHRTLQLGCVQSSDVCVTDFRSFLDYYERKQTEIRITVEEEQAAQQLMSVDLDEVSRVAALSPREREVLQLIAAGKNNREIAQALYISENTVKNHITSIFNKTGVSDRIQLMAKVIYKH